MLHNPAPSHLYFDHTLWLTQDALSDADIEPSSTHKYPVEDIKDAIIKQHGVEPRVMCDGEGNLAEVRGVAACRSDGGFAIAVPVASSQ